MAIRYTAIRWAREVPTLLHRGRVDRLGHHVLILAATYARNDGSSMYASPMTLARDAHASERDVVDALGRLEAAGLIERAPASNGAPGWSLRIDVRFDGDRVVEDRAERRRAADAARQARRREKLKAGSHATVDRDVTADSTVTEADVTQELPVSHAQLDRDKADVTQELPVSHASGTVTPAGQTGCNSLMNSITTELQDELQSDADASDDSEPTLIGIPRPKATKPKRSTTVLDEAFDRFWVPYPRKDKKLEARTAWTKAARKHGAEFLIAEAQRWAGLWAAASRDRQFIPMPTTWLNNERWTDEPPTPRVANQNGHRPFQNPEDPDAYYGELA